ncbi:MAG TPA: hypothetical protein VF014_01580 [Casimicrobiaceae bacterium]|nr:hypothetical protein [Casimicrobiaceae bacterium]
MCQTHASGDELFVDYACDTVAVVIDRLTGGRHAAGLAASYGLVVERWLTGRLRSRRFHGAVANVVGIRVTRSLRVDHVRVIRGDLVVEAFVRARQQVPVLMDPGAVEKVVAD